MREQYPWRRKPRSGRSSRILGCRTTSLKSSEARAPRGSLGARAPTLVPVPPSPGRRSPAQLLDLQIFPRSKTMARRWLRSPRIRNTFMVPPAASRAASRGTPRELSGAPSAAAATSPSPRRAVPQAAAAPPRARARARAPPAGARAPLAARGDVAGRPGAGEEPGSGASHVPRPTGRAGRAAAAGLRPSPGVHTHPGVPPHPQKAPSQPGTWLKAESHGQSSTGAWEVEAGSLRGCQPPGLELLGSGAATSPEPLTC